MKNNIYKIIFMMLALFTGFSSTAQNPLISGQFTADPSARVFGDKVYVFPSHDIPCTDGKGRPGWFCMPDYHVFSSENLTSWTDHGVIVDQVKTPWVDGDSYTMWAPDCIERNGKYYFYFPARPEDTTETKGFRIGVAVADRPEGPYATQPLPIAGVFGIDPNVFIDKDGQAYLYWSQGHIYGAKLKENMLELASEPQILQELPDKGLKEGPYLFERKGSYYLTYPHVANKTERLEYALGDNPLGPFRFTGVIMDESPTGCWTNHHSLIEFKNQWYLFYHHNDYSPSFDKNRSIRADSLFFEPNGHIRKVIPTLRGIGITPADTEIQVDRYSNMSPTGAAIAFLDTSNTFMGWKTVFSEAGAWVQYNSVDFGKKKFNTLAVKAVADEAASLEIRMNNSEGPLLSTISIPAGNTWQAHSFPVKLSKTTSIRNIIVKHKSGGNVEIDWIRFN